MKKTGKNRSGIFLTVLFTIISIGYVYPIVLVVVNSFKKKAYISKNPFSLPLAEMFSGIEWSEEKM